MERHHGNRLPAPRARASRLAQQDFFMPRARKYPAKSRRESLQIPTLNPRKYFAFSVRDLDHPIPANSFIAIHLSLSTGAQKSLSFGTGLPAAYRLLADSLRAAHPVTFFGTRPCYAGSSGGS